MGTPTTHSTSEIVGSLQKAVANEFEIAERIRAKAQEQQSRSGNKTLPPGESSYAYSREGFAQSGRDTLATIVGNGCHMPTASTEIAISYGGWAMDAEMAGEPKLAALLREYVAKQTGSPGMLVSEAEAYLRGVEKLLGEYALN